MVYMNVKFIEKSKYNYKFFIKNARFDLVNAIKRVIISDVNTYAVDTVRFFKNESVMPDEFLAHRIGLVPIYSEEVDEDREITLYLKKTGGMVYSGDIIVSNEIEIPLKHIPLVKLKEGKSIELELVLKVGSGKQHIKWSPALVFYNNMPILKQHKKVGKEVIDLCPKKLLEFKADKVILKDPYKCDICKYCEVATNGDLELDLNEEEFVLTIEPFGQLDVKTIIKSANRFLQKELSDLEKEIKKIK